MIKHAYLIMAHDKFDQLAFLLSLLDDPRNDIFVHIDKRSPFSQEDQEQLLASVSHSKLYLTNRMAAYWGDFSLVQCELLLYKASAEKGPYAFYHLLSGADLPLQSQDKIHTFFADKTDKIFITRYNQKEAETLKLHKLVEHYHFFRKLSPRNLSGLARKVLRAYQIAENKVQTLLKVDRLKGKRIEMGFDGFSQWKSFNHDVLTAILEEENFIYKHFRHTFCSDEYYFAMVAKKRNLLEQIYHYTPVEEVPDEVQGNLRYINWWDGRPYQWTDSAQDLAQLDKGIALGHFFSRKFDLTTHPRLKDYILKQIQKN